MVNLNGELSKLIPPGDMSRINPKSTLGNELISTNALSLYPTKKRSILFADMNNMALVINQNIAIVSVFDLQEV